MKWNIPTLEELEEKIWRCTACGNCKVAYDYGPPPMFGEICPAEIEFGFEGNASSKGKIAFARAILDGVPFDEDFVEDIYKCTVCAGCQMQCELDHKPFIPEIIEAMRRKAVEVGAGPMPQQKVISNSMRSFDNPYQGPRRVRLDWTRKFKKEGRPIKDINKEPAPVLYYVGCTGAYNVPVRGVPVATASIFQKLGIDFGILGDKEVCCGSTAMRIGYVEDFKRSAEYNLKLFKKLHEEKGVNTIVTSCAGCYRALKKDYTLCEEYEEMLEGITVIHTVDFLYNLYKEGKLEFKKTLNWKVTYHDPCHTGRHMMRFIIDEDGSKAWKGAFLEVDDSWCLFDAPRELLAAIPGIEFVEMERIKKNSFCCGGGGGCMTGFAEWAAKNASLRVKEALDVAGTDKIVSICPFCHYNINQGGKLLGKDRVLYDLVELIDMVL